MTAKKGRDFRPTPARMLFHCACIQTETRYIPRRCRTAICLWQNRPCGGEIRQPRKLLRGKKEQTPLPRFIASHPLVFLGGSFGVSGTPPAKPWECKLKMLCGWICSLEQREGARRCGGLLLTDLTCGRNHMTGYSDLTPKLSLLSDQIRLDAGYSRHRGIFLPRVSVSYFYK